MSMVVNHVNSNGIYDFTKSVPIVANICAAAGLSLELKKYNQTKALSIVNRPYKFSSVRHPSHPMVYFANYFTSNEPSMCFERKKFRANKSKTVYKNYIPRTNGSKISTLTQ